MRGHPSYTAIFSLQKRWHYQSDYCKMISPPQQRSPLLYSHFFIAEGMPSSEGGYCIVNGRFLCNKTYSVHSVDCGLIHGGCLTAVVCGSSITHPSKRCHTSVGVNNKITTRSIVQLVGKDKMVWFMLLNATFNNISVISWQSVVQ